MHLQGNRLKTTSFPGRRSAAIAAPLCPGLICCSPFGAKKPDVIPSKPAAPPTSSAAAKESKMLHACRKLSTKRGHQQNGDTHPLICEPNRETRPWSYGPPPPHQVKVTADAQTGTGMSGCQLHNSGGPDWTKTMVSVDFNSWVSPFWMPPDPANSRAWANSWGLLAHLTETVGKR